jgi:hypothetical protein
MDLDIADRLISLTDADLDSPSSGSVLSQSDAAFRGALHKSVVVELFEQIELPNVS